jgi:serine/threonine protein kinase
MNIAAGVARGLEYLHDKGVVYRAITSSDVLLGDGHHPKLSQYGLVDSNQELIDEGYAKHYSKSYFATHAPEFSERTVAANVFSFGVVLLELITGRRAAEEDQFLVTWVIFYDFADSRRAMID